MALDNERCCFDACLHILFGQVVGYKALPPFRPLHMSLRRSARQREKKLRGGEAPAPPPHAAALGASTNALAALTELRLQHPFLWQDLVLGFLEPEGVVRLSHVNRDYRTHHTRYADGRALMLTAVRSSFGRTRYIPGCSFVTGCLFNAVRPYLTSFMALHSRCRVRLSLFSNTRIAVTKCGKRA